MDLTTATPVEIDTILADLYGQAASLRTDASNAAARIFSYAERRPVGTKPNYYDRNPAPEATLDEAIAICESGETLRGYQVEAAKKQVATLREIREALAANRDEQAPLHAEFNRRGGWTRAYLVLANNGHVHKDMDCSTCFDVRYDETTGEWKPGTKFGWLPQMSGKDEAEIVEASGADACTVCFPSAPVASLSRPRRVLHRTEVEAAEARAAKAAAKAERDAKKAAKALVLDLKPFGLSGYSSRIETLAAAKSYLTDSNGWGGSHPDYPAAAVRHVAEAVAAKVGTTPEEEIAAAAKRYAKRR